LIDPFHLSGFRILAIANFSPLLTMSFA
jgi:hypothetical protein